MLHYSVYKAKIINNVKIKCTYRSAASASIMLVVIIVTFSMYTH